MLRNDGNEPVVNVVVHDINLRVPEEEKQQHRVAAAQAFGREVVPHDQPEWVVKFQAGVGDVPPHGGTKLVSYHVNGVGPLHGQDLAKAFESCSQDSDFRCEMNVDFSSVSGGRWRSRFDLNYHAAGKSITSWYIGTESI